MKVKGKTAAAFVLAVITGTVLLLVFKDSTPVHRGRSLAKWAADLDSPRTEERERAEAAFRAKGTNAAPYVIALLTASDSEARRKAKDLWEMQQRYNWPFATPEQKRARGLRACAALGPDAAAAVPALMNLFEAAPQRTHLLNLAIIETGPATAEPLCRFATDSDPERRKEAVRLLGFVGAEHPETALVLYRAINDPEVTWSAETALGMIASKNPESVRALLPELRRAFKRPDKELTGPMRVIGKFGTGAAELVPSVIECLGRRHEPLRVAAIHTLGLIAPGTEHARAAVEELRKSARTETGYQARLMARWTLGFFPEFSEILVPELTAGLASADPVEMEGCVRALDRLGPRAAAAKPALEKLAGDERHGSTVRRAILSVSPAAETES